MNNKYYRVLWGELLFTVIVRGAKSDSPKGQDKNAPNGGRSHPQFLIAKEQQEGERPWQEGGLSSSFIYFLWVLGRAAPSCRSELPIVPGQEFLFLADEEMVAHVFIVQ